MKLATIASAIVGFVGLFILLSFLFSWPVWMLWNGCLVGAIAWLTSYLERREKRRLGHLVAVRTADLAASEDRYRQLATELEHRVEHRTEELHRANTQLHSANTLLNDANAQLKSAKEAAETAD